MSGKELKQSRNLQARADVEGTEQCFFLACSACFLIRHRKTSPGIELHRRGWVSLHQSLMKKMPWRLAQAWFFWKHFLNWSSLLSDTFSLCQADIKVFSIINLFLMCHTDRQIMIKPPFLFVHLQDYTLILLSQYKYSIKFKCKSPIVINSNT